MENNLNEIVIDPFMTLTFSFIVFFAGAYLTRNVSFLKDYNIPEPVSGGLVAAALVWAYMEIFSAQVTFDLAVRDELLVIFFATIGLNARIADLFTGGVLLFKLLLLTAIFIFVQNAIGLLGANLFDLPSATGVLLGSAALIGGHGTSIAWGPTIEEMTGFAAADELGIANATLGLVSGALLGGPIAKILIERYKLKSTEHDTAIVGIPFSEDKKGEIKEDMVNHVSILRGMLAAHVAVILGYSVNHELAAIGVKLPLFVPTLLMAIVMSNTIPYIFPKIPWPARTKALAVISEYTLSVFLAMSLMSMQLWTLSGLGPSLMVTLVLQVAVTTAFIFFILFKVMGSNYTAAVLSSGFAGFGLGATPTAIANMSAVTKHYGAAPLAFIILPLVSAFFIDLVNAFAIKLFIGF